MVSGSPNSDSAARVLPVAIRGLGAVLDRVGAVVLGLHWPPPFRRRTALDVATGGDTANSVMGNREYHAGRFPRDQGDTNLCKYDSGRHGESCRAPDAGDEQQM